MEKMRQKLFRIVIVTYAVMATFLCQFTKRKYAEDLEACKHEPPNPCFEPTTIFFAPIKKIFVYLHFKCPCAEGYKGMIAR